MSAGEPGDEAPLLRLTFSQGGAVASGSAPTPRQRGVPLPRSLHELKQAAALQLGASGRNPRVRIFHNGRELLHPMSVAAIKEGDEVTVKVEPSRPLLQAGDQLVSTAQAAFVQHPLTPRQPVPRPVASSASALAPSGRFEGQTSYESDFVRHVAPERTQAVLPNQAAYKMHFMQQAAEADRKSTYANVFKWHDRQPQLPADHEEGSVLTDASRGHPFTGSSSYKEHYAGQRAPPPEQPVHNTWECSLKGVGQAFDGQTQYLADFVQPPSGCRPPASQRRAAALGEPVRAPFAGSSEYRQQYQSLPSKAPVLLLKEA